jgi:hypothetical protein
MSRANGAAPHDPLDDLDDVISELEGSEWDDEITETNITVEKGATVVITGKHQAVSKDQAAAVTKPDNPPPDSQPPKAKFALAVLATLPPHWRGPVVVVALGILGILVWRGGSLVKLWP